MPRQIQAWSLQVVWDTGEVENITDIPNFAAKEVDLFLDELEEQARKDADEADAEDEGYETDE